VRLWGECPNAFHAEVKVNRGHRSPALVMTVCLAVSAACRAGEKTGGGKADPPVALTPADEAAIRGADSAFMTAVNAADVNGIVGVYAADAALLPPNLPIQRGHDAVKAFWSGFLDVYTVRMETGSDIVEGRGDLAYNVGHYRFTAVPKAKGAPGVADEGKFVEVLKKQPDGSWKYVVDMYSSNLAQH
jgi:ketosteroid isomerase-like protein